MKFPFIETLRQRREERNRQERINDIIRATHRYTVAHAPTRSVANKFSRIEHDAEWDVPKLSLRIRRERYIRGDIMFLYSTLRDEQQHPAHGLLTWVDQSHAYNNWLGVNDIKVHNLDGAARILNTRRGRIAA